MNRLALLAVAALATPASAFAATIVDENGGPYDITSDTLFTGIVESSADGPGSYVIQFFTSGQTRTAVADAAVTAATVDLSFAGLTMSWIDGLTLNALVSETGVDTLTTVFDGNFPTQQLRFDWSDSTGGNGFRVDVQTSSAVPVPASLLLMGPAFAGLGLMARRRRMAKAAAV